MPNVIKKLNSLTEPGSRKLLNALWAETLLGILEGIAIYKDVPASVQIWIIMAIMSVALGFFGFNVWGDHLADVMKKIPGMKKHKKRKK